MKIIKMTARNIQKLKAVEIEPSPEDNTVVVKGKNGAGKTSVLDSIYYALAGKRSIPDEPVREGADEAEVRLELGENSNLEYIVIRRWTDNDNTYLKVKTPEGTEVSSKQSVLNELVGELAFDPLEFSQLRSKEQREQLIELTGINIEELQEKRENAYDERRMVNREVKNLKGELSGIEVPDNAPDKKPEAKEILDELEDKKEQRSEAQKLDNRADDILEKIKNLQSELADVQERREKIDVPSDDEISELEDQLDQIEEQQEAYRQKQERQKIEKKLQEKQAESESLTEKIEEIDQTKQDKIENAEMPVDGLGFTENGVTYDGVPFEQCASSEQLRISTAVAMAYNPDLRILRITDGSLLDSENMKVLKEMASKNDYQVWIEVVDEDAEQGVVIEDGTVRNNSNGSDS